ncbi:MAG: M23 family metallopeptidase [Ornithinimicrobium sp.]
MLTPEGSVEQANAGTGALGAAPADVAPVSQAIIRSASAPSRGAARPVLNRTEDGGLQKVTALGGHAAVASAQQASAKVKQSVRKETRRAAFASPIEGARITSGYGQRWGRMHYGMDFGAEVGHPLYAVTDAEVTTASYNSGLGYHVRITMANGTEVSYGHMSKVAVEEGDVVKPGTVIGQVGNSGSSTGAHLHFEVRSPNGKRVDPHTWLTDRGLLS